MANRDMTMNKGSIKYTDRKMKKRYTTTVLGTHSLLYISLSKDNSVFHFLPTMEEFREYKLPISQSLTATPKSPANTWKFTRCVGMVMRKRKLFRDYTPKNT